MRILFATSEAVPFWKTGGLADVSRALPDALVARGHEVLIVHPYYRFLDDAGLPLEVGGYARIPWPGGAMTVRYLSTEEDGFRKGEAPTLFVDQPYYFDVEDPYGPTRFDRLAAGRRFALFCRAVVDRARAWGAELIHLNDWPTGLVPLYARIDRLPTPTLFSIHNMGYQGNFPPGLLPEIGVPSDFYRIDDGVEFYGTASFLKAGLSMSDRLSTVSPSYAREIQTPDFGAGFEGLLHSRRGDLHGILNGIDTRVWDPAADPAVPMNYDVDSLAAKELNRVELLRELGFDDRGPLFVVVSRLVEQKGIEFILDSLDALIGRGVRIAVLGSGDRRYEDALARAAEAFPRHVAAFFRFDEGLARRLYAGGDYFLMPSLYEPCGLGQMIAQRYGTPPIVRATGGLADTVEDGVTGFTFEEPTAEAFQEAVGRALWSWRGPDWNAMRRRCMRLDRSWRRSAAEYEALYDAILSGR